MVDNDNDGLPWQFCENCFCTMKSLLTLNFTDENSFSKLTHLTENILKSLMINMELSELQASKLFYNSKTFTELLKECNGKVEEPWEVILKKLENEIK